MLPLGKSVFSILSSRHEKHQKYFRNLEKTETGELVELTGKFTTEILQLYKANWHNENQGGIHLKPILKHLRLKKAFDLHAYRR